MTPQNPTPSASVPDLVREFHNHKCMTPDGSQCQWCDETWNDNSQMIATYLLDQSEEVSRLRNQNRLLQDSVVALMGKMKICREKLNSWSSRAIASAKSEVRHIRYDGHSTMDAECVVDEWERERKEALAAIDDSPSQE